MIVRTDIFDQVPESNKLNNTTASADVVSVTVPELHLGVPLSTTLATGQTQLYQVTVAQGQTLRVDLTSSDPAASNELYLRYNAVPTGSVYDAIYQGPLQANQYAVIPSTKAGVYYVLVRGQSEPSGPTAVTLLAQVLPFEVTDVTPDNGGDSKYVTTTITGAQFSPDAVVKLVRPGFAEYEPASYQVVNSTTIVAIFDLTSAPHGLYDIEVINPDGSTAFAPYRYLVEQALPPDVTVGLGGPRVVWAGSSGLYGFTLQSLTNVDIPYVEFQYGIPALPLNPGDGSSPPVPYLGFTTNLGADSDPNVSGVAWDTAGNVINTGGEDLATGYAVNFADRSNIGLTFNVQTYPNGLPPGAGMNPPAETAFAFHIMAAATPLTGAEFVAQQTAFAEQLRQAILKDPTAAPGLQILAADATNWDALYLTALSQAGILQPVDVPPAVRANPLVPSLIATLSAGILAGPAGQQIITTGNLTQFFAQVRTWYGGDQTQVSPYIGTGEDLNPADDDGSGPYLQANTPPASMYDLQASQPTHFEAFNVYVPYANDFDAGPGDDDSAGSDVTHPENPNFVTVAPPNLTQYLSATAAQGQDTITGPYGFGVQQFVPVGHALPYTIQFANPAGASSTTNQIQIIEQLDPKLDPRSFRLGSLQIGDLSVNIPAGLGSFQGDFDYTDTKGFILRVSAGIDISSDAITWLIQAIDPNTGTLIQNPTRGLLPPNDASGAGEGFVTYTVQPLAGLATGTTISAQAQVQLNNAPPQTTNTATSTVDGTAPTTTLTVAPITPGGSDYNVQWTATDDPGGSGVKSVTVFVSEDGGDYQIWLDQTTATSGIYNGQAGHMYQFLALATDNAGNVEPPPPPLLVPDSGSGANLGTLPTVTTTQTSLGTPAQPTGQSTNALFTQAQQGIPASTPASNPSEFKSVLQPFSAQAFATGIGQSEAGIGPLALLPLPDHTVLASGGPARNQLFLFPSGGGTAGTPLATEPFPIYDMALDSAGNVWATTGGGPLVELNPTTVAVLGQWGDSLTQSLAIQPGTGLIYVSSGSGIEIFDPVAHTFRHYSDIRVGSLAFAPDGSLWAAAWPDSTNDVVRFDLTKPQSAVSPQVMLQFAAPVDSIAFGVSGSKLDGLLFVSHDEPDPGASGTELSMVDLATLQQVAVATGGTRGDELKTSADGRVFLSQTNQIDVISPIQPPLVSSTNPPAQGLVALPLGSLSVTFDEDMLADSPTDPNSVTNPANYTLVGDNAGPITISGVTYAAATRTAVLTFDSLAPDHYTLTVGIGVEAANGLTLVSPYATDFRAVADATALVTIHFANGRADAVTQTYSYDITLTNITGYDILAPFVLTFDSLGPTDARVLNLPGQQSPTGTWWVDLSSAVAGGRLTPGQTSAPITITFSDPSGLRPSFQTGALAMPAPSAPPIIDSQPVATGAVGQEYQYQVAAHDPNDAALSYLLYQGPAGMTIDPRSGLITWTPTVASPGQASVIVEVYNSRGSHAQQTFTVSVSGVNAPPVFTSLPAIENGQEGQQLQIAVSATDPADNPLVYWADNLPPGAVFDEQQQTLTWTPAAGQAGTYLNVTFFVSDGISTVSETTTLLIAPTVQPPAIQRPADRTVLEGESIHIPLAATDPNGLALTYSSAFLPGGAYLDPNTGVFDWTPGYDQHGVYQVPFTVNNGQQSTTVTTTFTVLNVNAPPVFDNLGGWRVAEGQDITFLAFATDPNNPGFIPQDRTANGTLTPLEGTNPTITYTVSGLPADATFDPVTAEFNWRTGYTDAGTYNVTFTATNDGDGTGTPLSTSVTVPITVLNVNQAPVVPTIANQTVNGGATLALPVTATDPDGDPLKLTVTGLPTFATFMDNGDGTGQFQFAPGLSDRGNYTITLTATDNGDGNGRYAILSTSQSFVLSVNVPNEPPHLVPTGDKVAVIGQPLQFTLQATDGDQDPLTFSALGLPGTATLTPTNTYGQAVFAWTPADADAGMDTVVFQVADNGNNGAGPVLGDEQTVHITVRASDDAPMFPPVNPQAVVAGQPFSVTVAATDADGNALTYAATGLPPGAAIDPRTGTITWTPNTFEEGNYTIGVTASDGYLSASTTVSVTVAHLNQAPTLVPLVPQSGARGRRSSSPSSPATRTATRLPTAPPGSRPARRSTILRASSSGPRTTFRRATTRSSSVPPMRPG